MPEPAAVTIPILPARRMAVPLVTGLATAILPRSGGHRDGDGDIGPPLGRRGSRREASAVCPFDLRRLRRNHRPERSMAGKLTESGVGPGGLRHDVTAALLAAVLVMLAVAEASTEPPGRRSLAGRLLVATDTLRDPRFARSVIYVARHDAQGAFGLVINMPVGEIPFERVLRPFGLEVPPGSGNVRVHYGGPVDEERGLVLHTPDWTGEDTTVVGGGFAFTG